MERASIGGRANWTGAVFELRLGVEFCVYILAGEYAGLGPGAACRLQLQAPEAIDDLVLEFDTGARWAIQAKAGSSVRVEWHPDRPFGKALRQLYRGVASASPQIDRSADSLDRVELAVDHRAHPSVSRFASWLEKARHHLSWERFAAAASGPEREWVQELPALLDAPPDDDLLAFLRHCYVRMTPDPDRWWGQLRGQLRAAGVPDNATADRILGVLLAQVAQAAPHAGQLDAGTLRRACGDIPGLPRPGASPFHVFSHPTEDELYQALRMPRARPGRFVERRELAAALDSDRGVFVAGRPGSGKSHALIKLALARPEWPVVVVARHFQPEDLSRLVVASRRIHTRYQLLWDDVHERPDLFADTVQRLVASRDHVRVLASYRAQHRAAVRERVTPDFCRRAGIIPEPVRMRPFDERQAAEMAHAVTQALDLALDEPAHDAFARHICQGDGGPLFALAVGLALREDVAQGRQVRAADVARLPERLLDIWRHLYDRFGDRHGGRDLQNVLGVLRFLHRVGCPLDVRLVELLFVHVLGSDRGTFDGAVRELVREGWLRWRGEDLSAHDVTLEAVPANPARFRRFVRFARQGMAGEELALGLLRDALGRYFYGKIAVAPCGDERRTATENAVSFGTQAVGDFRAAGSAARLGMALSNTSVFVSALAGLEETRAGRGERLEQAVAAIEESVRLYRELGLQADLAMSLGSATRVYRAVAMAVVSPQERITWLRRALESIEGAVERFRMVGIARYLILALRDDVISHLQLAECTEELDRDGVLALCVEGEVRCKTMEDEDGLAFFRQVRETLEGVV